MVFGTFPIKSIVLIDFTDIVRISICPSISAADNNPTKPSGVSNLRESSQVAGQDGVHRLAV